MRLVSPNCEVRKERFDGFFEGDAVGGQLVSFEVVFEVGRLELIPLDHELILALRSSDTDCENPGKAALPAPGTRSFLTSLHPCNVPAIVAR